MSSSHRTTVATVLAAAALVGLAAPAQAITPEQLLAEYTARAGMPASAERGQKFFTAKQPGAFGWSCSTCHGEQPTTAGTNAVSDKPIAPLAPAFNAQRFVDKTKVESWFRDNCKDTVGRECSAIEKADLLAWLLSFKR